MRFFLAVSLTVFVRLSSSFLKEILRDTIDSAHSSQKVFYGGSGIDWFVHIPFRVSQMSPKSLGSCSNDPPMLLQQKRWRNIPSRSLLCGVPQALYLPESQEFE